MTARIDKKENDPTGQTTHAKIAYSLYLDGFNLIPFSTLPALNQSISPSQESARFTIQAWSHVAPPPLALDTICRKSRDIVLTHRVHESLLANRSLVWRQNGYANQD